MNCSDQIDETIRVQKLIHGKMAWSTEIGSVNKLKTQLDSSL